ncbi:MAG: S9 family peptidase [Burkholderiales bacterium]|nr:S9 family peptidase [Burkholderiales bacterium]MDE2453981.1 S9 family peptidase [Burkholderiales bacterium]
MKAPEDRFLWLEEVLGEPALAWVRARNAESEAKLEAEPGFAATEQALLEVLDSRAQIPYPTRRGDWLYNFWRDADHPRGLWRRTTLAEYRRPEPAWELVLDLDALAAAENENWVWGGADAFGPEYRRALVSLSRGGADAHVVREFDLVDKRFVAGGFELPEAKSDCSWLGPDELLVGTDFGPGSLTDSGYPRVIRRWRRGDALAAASTVFEGEAGDVAASASVDRTPGLERRLFTRALDFYRSRTWLLQDDGSLVEIDKPEDAQIDFWRERLLFELRSDWTLGERRWPAGSLLVADAAAWLRGERSVQALFTPTARRSLAGYTLTRSTLIANLLDDVASRLEAWREHEGGWRGQAIEAPSPGSLSVGAWHDPLLADDPWAEAYLVNYTDFLSPDSLRLGHTAEPGFETLKSRPAYFDATGMRAEQRFATSADGTRVPYFVVWPKGARADGDNPTLLSAYGGFEVPLLPGYSGTTGRAWLARGGVYVLANLRGGGEYGPAWHQAARRENKQRSYDDLAAVAEDLARSGITRPARLGIQGGSNGGLLVGAVMLQRPELFGAVVCQVPLLDMKRYHRLLAGASWLAEYGDPDDPADWAFISRYSPYQALENLSAGRRLPPVLFTTSTRDDRVHPGHARKMAARLIELGQPVLYWENLEGGHGGAADNRQRARMLALEFAFLWMQLGRR